MRSRFLAVLVIAATVVLLITPSAIADYDWVSKNGPVLLDEITNLAYDGSNEALYAGTSSNGVYRTLNPQAPAPTWVQVNGSLSSTSIHSMLYDGTRNVLYAGTEDGVSRLVSPDTNNTWNNFSAPTMSGWIIPSLAFDPANQYLYAGTDNSRVWRCKNPHAAPSAAWQDTGGPAPVAWVNSLIYDGVNGKLYAGLSGDQGLHRCENPAGPIPPPLTWNPMGGAAGVLIGVDFKQDAGNNVLYAATRDSVTGEYQVWSTADPTAAPVAWTDTERPDGWDYVDEIYFEAGSAILYAATGEGVQRCDSPGSSPSWSDTGGAIDTDGIGSIAYDGTRDVIYAGTENNGVYAARIIFPPDLDSITPTSGPVGTEVTLNGEYFGPTQGAGGGASYVSFGTVQATEYSSWSDTQVKCLVPEGVSAGEVDVTLTTDAGATDARKFTVEEFYYFAEGYTGTGFQEYLCIGNSGGTKTDVDVTYLYKDGATEEATYQVPATSRYTVNVNEEIGPGKEVSLKIKTTSASIVAERPMYFNYQGLASHNWPGGHDTVGAPSPADKWYFAEGTTRGEFEEWITVLNPNSSAVNLTFRYMVEGEGEVVKEEQVGENSRSTFSAADHVGTGKDISLLVESDGDVVVERPMYFNYQGLASHNWPGGHCVMGTNAPGKEWYFAEGTTRAGFEEWLCLQNPGESEITVAATYMLGPGQGDPLTAEYKVPAKERLTVPVNEEIGPDKDVSVKLVSEDEFIAERPLYFDYHGAWPGGHDVIGTNSSAKSWFFAEGYTGEGFEEWLCVQNPGVNEAMLTVTYYPTSGDSATKEHRVEGNSRLTVDVNLDAGAGMEISVMVESDQPVIVERPMYFNYNGIWPGGHDVLGFTGR